MSKCGCGAIDCAYCYWLGAGEEPQDAASSAPQCSDSDREVGVASCDSELEAIKQLIERWAAGFEGDDIVKAYRALLRMLEETNVRMLRDEERVENAERAWNAALTERDELRAKLAEAETHGAVCQASALQLKEKLADAESVATTKAALLEMALIRGDMEQKKAEAAEARVRELESELREWRSGA